VKPIGGSNGMEIINHIVDFFWNDCECEVVDESIPG
jgi:hypothetical protein